MCVCVCWTICIAWHMRFWPDASRCSPLEVNQQKKKDSFPAKRFTNDRRRLGCCTFDRAHGISHKRHTTKRNFRIRARGLFDSFYGNRKQQQQKKNEKLVLHLMKKKHTKKKRSNRKNLVFFHPVLFMCTDRFLSIAFAFFCCCFEAVLPGCWCSSVVDAAAAA